MPPFPEPGFVFQYDAEHEIAALRRWRDTKPGRAIPARRAGRVLLASWNIANLGDPKQVRSDADIALLAEVISWFDIVAVQEVKTDLTDLFRVLARLPAGWRSVFSDEAGNDERLAFLHDGTRVRRLDLAGEVAIPPASHRYIRLKGIAQKFRGFDRNPYAVAFGAGEFVITVANAHSYFGSDSAIARNRRALETYALGRWADLRAKRDYVYSANVVVIGDLNMPKAEVGDAIFDALTERGLEIPDHQTHIGTTITEGKYYDQLAFFPGDAGEAYTVSGVFDFDGAVFADLWRARSEKEFETYLRYHLSDHRPIWAQFET